MKPAAAAIAMILVAGLSTTAQAVETETLTLVCNGVGGAEGKLEPIVSLSLIFNFTAGTVQGFGAVPDLDYPIKITGINELTVAFGSVQTSKSSLSFSGTIDRVTGQVLAKEIGRGTKTGKTFVSTGYSLICRPTHRMF
jgi:hypothetical protein